MLHKTIGGIENTVIAFVRAGESIFTEQGIVEKYLLGQAIII
jgi:hypothetical protein